MSYTIDKEKIVQIGKELGLEVQFGSDTPGVRNKKTGEVTPLQNYFSDFLTCEESQEEGRENT